MKAFKNIRSAKISGQHFVIRATLNLSEPFSGIQEPAKEWKLSKLVSIFILASGLRLVNRILVDYPQYAILTTDKEMAKIIGRGKEISAIKTKYLAGRWCNEYEPFDLFFTSGKGYPITYLVEAAVGATISWETESPTWPTAQHVLHLILSKRDLDSTFLKHLSEAGSAVSFESAILAQDAVLIFPEFGEPLMPPEWRTDSIFSDHQYEFSYQDAPPGFSDIYVVTREESVAAILDKVELP